MKQTDLRLGVIEVNLKKNLLLLKLLNLGKTTRMPVLPMAANLHRRVQFLKRFDFTLPLKMLGNKEQPVLSWM